MNILKTIILCSALLLSSGCSQTANVPDASSSPVMSATTTVDTSVNKDSLKPVKDGDHFVFTDPEYGYSLKFPEDFYFNASPELEKQLDQMMKNTMDIELPKSVGLRFFVFRYKPDSVEFNPNLNCTVEAVPIGAGDLDTKEYTKIAREQLKNQLKAKLEDEATPVNVNGKEFYRSNYTFTLPGTNLNLRARVYSHYDPDSRIAYGFTIGTTTSDTSDDMEELDKVFQTLKLP